MDLTTQDRQMLEGEHGEGTALAMRVLVGVGEAFDAPHLVDVSRTHVALSNQEADTWFAKRLADGGARARVAPQSRAYSVIPGTRKAPTSTLPFQSWSWRT